MAASYALPIVSMAAHRARTFVQIFSYAERWPNHFCYGYAAKILTFGVFVSRLFHLPNECRVGSFLRSLFLSCLLVSARVSSFDSLVVRNRASPVAPSVERATRYTKEWWLLLAAAAVAGAAAAAPS